MRLAFFFQPEGCPAGPSWAVFGWKVSVTMPFSATVRTTAWEACDVDKNECQHKAEVNVS